MAFQTKTGDIEAIATIALDFAAGESWIIAARVQVTSRQNVAVQCLQNDGALDNFGRIFSGSTDGVYFNADANSIVNEVGGSITGNVNAVELAGTRGSFVNHGTVESNGYGVLLEGSGHAAATALTNAGTIFGHFAGVDVTSSMDPGAIRNTGSIRADYDGIVVLTGPGLVTPIVNGAAGTIGGSNTAIRSNGQGAISLSNHGKIIGEIECGSFAANDQVSNGGTIQGRVELGGGDDRFNGAGGKSGPVFGENGDDRLIGGSHADLLHGGAGLDRLTGRAGADRIFFDTAPDATTNVDVITDFTAGIDKIVLSKTYFPAIGPTGQPLHAGLFQIGGHATTAGQRIIYNPNTGFLSFDPDGSSPANHQVHFATVASHLALHNTDFLVLA